MKVLTIEETKKFIKRVNRKKFLLLSENEVLKNHGKIYKYQQNCLKLWGIDYTLKQMAYSQK